MLPPAPECGACPVVEPQLFLISTDLYWQIFFFLFLVFLMSIEISLNLFGYFTTLPIVL